MPFIRPIDLPGKRIRWRSGYDGNEPREILRAAHDLSENQERFVVVVESYYPGILRESYVNKDVLALVQHAIRENGLHVICEDIFSPGMHMPEEQPGVLSEDEDYLLVNDAEEPVGRLQLWMYTWSSGGVFYGEFDLIVDMVVPKGASDGLRRSLNRLAEAHSVSVKDHGCAAERPEHVRKRSLLGRVLGFLTPYGRDK